MYHRVIILFMVIVFTALMDETKAIKCYQCTAGPTSTRRNQTQHLCSKFEESDEYLVDCPYSTMCMKKVYQLQLMDGKVIETFSRNCAHQKYTEMVLKDNSWQDENTVEEPYEEGCITQKENNGKNTIYCHCRGSYCNSAPKDSPSYHTDAMAVIFVFNAMKYLRSID